MVCWHKAWPAAQLHRYVVGLPQSSIESYKTNRFMFEYLLPVIFIVHLFISVRTNAQTTDKQLDRWTTLCLARHEAVKMYKYRQWSNVVSHLVECLIHYKESIKGTTLLSRPYLDFVWVFALSHGSKTLCSKIKWHSGAALSLAYYKQQMNNELHYQHCSFHQSWVVFGNDYYCYQNRVRLCCCCCWSSLLTQ